jgi:hypothetical protein
MTPHDHQSLPEAIRTMDARLRALIGSGIDLSSPGLLERLRATRDERRRQFAELEEAQKEADLLLPEMLDLYINGSNADREMLRDVLLECRSFRWGFGWGLSDRIATEDDARNALAVFSMTDGGSDPRDQIVALDHLYAVMRRAGLPVAPLLAEAAAWSSDTPRYEKFRSTRALLLDYAQRL